MFTPKELVGIAEKTAEAKLALRFDKVLMLAFLAGTYIAMGGLLSLLLGSGMPEITAQNPGLQKCLSGMAFPIGLILVVLAGAELFTGNNAVLMPGVLNRSYPWRALFKNWTLVYLGNFAGAFFFVYFMTYLTGVVSADPWHSAIIKMAETKTSMPFYVVFLKGIGANWLVCLGVWLGMSATDTLGKIIGLWWPVMCFVAIGFEHCIANMFFIPLGILEGAPVSWGQFLYSNLLPSTLGNIVGGAFFVGTLYWYAYGRDASKTVQK